MKNKMIYWLKKYSMLGFCSALVQCGHENNMVATYENLQQEVIEHKNSKTHY